MAFAVPAPSPTHAARPVMLGIVGDSAAGKTTLSQGVAEIIGRERVALVCADDYHRYARRERQARNLAPADPDNNYLEIIEQHLWLLRQGRAILKPVYDHAQGELSAPILVEPRPYIIVEGLLAFATRAMRDCFDVKIYLEPDEAVRARWKLRRDTRRRGYTEAEVRRLMTRDEAASAAHIQPQRLFADIVVGFQPPEGRPDEPGAALDARHMLRPTLPHPDLSPLLESSLDAGLTLDLSRDRDGKPVDVLQIAGTIDPRRAKRLEDLIWALIPEHAHAPTALGVVEDEGPGGAISHPLALTQLLIAYHMEKAARDQMDDRRRAGATSDVRAS